MTTRRQFLGMLGALAAAPAVKPLVALAPLEETCVIGQWAEYCSFSDFTLMPAIAPEIWIALDTLHQARERVTGVHPDFAADLRREGFKP